MNIIVNFSNLSLKYFQIKSGISNALFKPLYPLLAYWPLFLRYVGFLNRGLGSFRERYRYISVTNTCIPRNAHNTRTHLITFAVHVNYRIIHRHTPYNYFRSHYPFTRTWNFHSFFIFIKFINKSIKKSTTFLICSLRY